jgi:hypothetical protein
MTLTRIFINGGAALILAVVVGACGGTTSSASPSGSTQVVGPVILDSTMTTAEVAVGRVVTFALDDPAAWTIAADHAELVTISQGGEQGGALFNPGITTLGAGVVAITATNADGTTLTFTITIK